MKFPRWLKVFSVVVLLLLTISFFVVPPFIKSYLKKHSKEWIGRAIDIEGARFNIFNGSFTLYGFRLFEKDDTTVFVSFDKLYINTALLKCISGDYEISEAAIDKPFVNISQSGSTYNFSDLLKRFETSETDSITESDSKPVEYLLQNLSIQNGSFEYHNKDLDSKLGLDKVNIRCPQIAWNVLDHQYLFDFLVTQGGRGKGTFNVNLNTLEYSTSYQLDSLNLQILLPYVKDYMQAGNFTGLLTSHQQVSGDFDAPEAIATSGMLLLNEISLTDPQQGDLVSASEFHLLIDSINVIRELYDFGHISLRKPYLKFELFPDGNNFSHLLNQVSDENESVSSDSLSSAVAYGNIFALMAVYIQELSKNYAISNYKADSVVLREGKFVFNDYTLHRKFNYVLEDLLVKANRVNSADSNITFIASSILNTSGKMKGQIAVNPDGFRDMEIDYSISDLNVKDFNPYSDYYVAHPFTDGLANYNSHTVILNRYLKSEHKINIQQLKVGKKEKNSTAYDLPIRLAVALLRDKNGDVKLDIPIEGDLDDPKYKIGKIVWQVIKNLISKAAAAPGKLLSSKAGVDEKLLEGFVWDPLQTELNENQKEVLDAMIKSLETTPELKLELIKEYNFQRELDELALRESKKRFLFFHRKIDNEDNTSEEEERMVEGVHEQDSLFMAFVERESNTQNSLLSIFDKSKRLIGNERLQRKLNYIFERRMEVVNDYWLNVKKMPADRLRMVDPQAVKEVSYETSSYMRSRFYTEE